MSNEQSAGKPDRTPSLAALLIRSSPWSDWLDQAEIGPLAQLRIAAVLLRGMSVPALIDRLAPAIIAAEAQAVGLLERYLKDRGWTGEALGFEHWLFWWEDRQGQPFADAVSTSLAAVAATNDQRYFARLAASRDIDEITLLWFLLGGIRNWAWEEQDRDLVSDDARWLFDLMTAEGRHRDQLGALFVFLYERMRRASRLTWGPVDDALQLVYGDALFYDASRPLEVSETLLRMRLTGPHAQLQTLATLLDDDARAWPKAAARIIALREEGLF